MLARRPQLEPGRCLARSWKLLTSNFGTLFGATLLIWLIGTACELNPLTGIVYHVMRGVFFGGLYLVFLRKIRGQQAVVGDAFAGFNVGFGQLLLVGFLTSLLSWIGLCCCLIAPGIYLCVAWTFSVPLVADRRMEFWSAMELSRKIATRVWFELFWLLILALLPFVVSYIVMEVKLVITLYPVMHDFGASSTPDFSKMFQVMLQTAKASLPLVFATKLVLLLNLPFALGALMYAYEDIFGAGTAPTT